MQTWVLMNPPVEPCEAVLSVEAGSFGTRSTVSDSGGAMSAWQSVHVLLQCVLAVGTPHVAQVPRPQGPYPPHPPFRSKQPPFFTLLGKTVFKLYAYQ